MGIASCTASPARQTWARWPCWSWCPPAEAKGNLQVRVEVDFHLDLCTLVCQLDYWHRCFVQHLKVVSFRNQWTKHVIDIQCLVWLYDTSSKLANGNLSKYLKFMPSLVTSVKEIHAAIPIIPIISTWWKMGSKGTLIRETSGKNTWIGGHWKMWPPVSCLFVLHSPLSHSSHRVTSKIITVSSFSTL